MIPKYFEIYFITQTGFWSPINIPNYILQRIRKFWRLPNISKYIFLRLRKVVFYQICDVRCEHSSMKFSHSLKEYKIIWFQDRYSKKYVWFRVKAFLCLIKRSSKKFSLVPCEGTSVFGGHVSDSVRTHYACLHARCSIASFIVWEANHNFSMIAVLWYEAHYRNRNRLCKKKT